MQRLDALVRAIRAARPPAGVPSRVVAVDGPGGAGKSTLAAALAHALGGAPVVPTDDFASWEVPVGGGPRLRDEVLRRLAAGEPVRYRAYDWSGRRLGRAI